MGRVCGTAYAGYAPTKYAAEKTPLDKVLAVVQEPASLTMLGTLTRNVAQAPRDEKFRRVRLTNPKIAAALVDVNGAVDVMLHLGWIHVSVPTPLVAQICLRTIGLVSGDHGVARACRTPQRCRRTHERHACAPVVCW